MNFFLVLMFCSCIAAINANYGITKQTPITNTSISSSTTQFILQINQTVNRPSFQAFIHFYNAITNALIYQIDAHLDTVNVTYSNSTLTFQTLGFNVSDEFYITFDAGVLFSNDSNSSAITDPNFWHLKVIDTQTSTSVTNTVAYTSMGTTQQVSTGTSMTSYESTMMHTTQNVNTTSINIATVVTGEPPPTQSAKIGMGLGITFISILIIIEIIYFKYCHSGDGRSASYYT